MEVAPKNRPNDLVYAIPLFANCPFVRGDEKNECFKENKYD
jgi:hypothetical protein